MTEPTAFLDLDDGRRIAFRHCPGDGPVLVFLPGYMSDMAGSKASALVGWAREHGRGCVLLDYSGCGESPGDFAEGTLSRWAEEVHALIATRVDAPVVLVGSSMGGWLMLLVGEALGDRLAGMIGIAAAPDFTQWGTSEADKTRLEAGETVFEPNPYGPEPTPTHPGFYRDAQARLCLSRSIAITCPVHLLHGQRDPDVPWQISLELAGALRSDAVQVTLIKDGDHRLSRPQDIALLLRAAATICEA